MIFKWFDEDFSKHSGAVLKHIAQYVNDRELAADSGNYSIKHLEYNWSLNGTPPPGNKCTSVLM